MIEAKEVTEHDKTRNDLREMVIWKDCTTVLGRFQCTLEDGVHKVVNQEEMVKNAFSAVLEWFKDETLKNGDQPIARKDIWALESPLMRSHKKRSLEPALERYSQKNGVLRNVSKGFYQLCG